LDRAFANYYAGRARYPRFKRRTDREGSFVVRDVTVQRLNKKWGLVTVPKVGRVRFRISRLWADVARATSARVTYRNGRWHICFTTPPAEKITAGTGDAAGIDRGVTNTLATSDGRMIQAPSLTNREKERFVRLQQQLSRQQKGSRRRQKTLDLLAVLRRRLQDRNTDWVEQTTTRLARTYDRIAVEDLRVANMTRRPAPKADPERPGVFLPNGARAKAALNRVILASLWGRFLTRLEHKMPEGSVLRVDPKNTSRTCAACGHCAPENRDSQAVFACVACGHAAHADTNAAVVILDRALDTTAAGHAVTGRRSPAFAGSANQPAARRLRIPGLRTEEDVNERMLV
jgi:putative transposase